MAFLHKTKVKDQATYIGVKSLTGPKGILYLHYDLAVGLNVRTEFQRNLFVQS